MSPFVVILAVLVGVCSGGSFSNTGGGKCWIPTWRCDCKIVHDCDGDGAFPEELEPNSTVAAVLKDLAPETYLLEIPGKRWRRSVDNQEAFCKRECKDRMNAFLCLEESGDFSSYSSAAVCLKLLQHESSPFAQDGSNEPCCTIYLQYGRAWCSEKWYNEVGTVRCLTRNDVDFSSATAAEATSHVFSTEEGCTVDSEGSFNWCDPAPTCTATTTPQPTSPPSSTPSSSSSPSSSPN